VIDKTLTKYFKFKQFIINDSTTGMPVSTDGVILGAWALLPTTGHILDVGTGTGLLSLMIAQRYLNINITAIDIDEHAIQAATQNCLTSCWNDRITVLQKDINHYVPQKKFSGIICNPPYFIHGKTANVPQRAIARHTHCLTHHQLLHCSYHITTENGLANFILPLVESEQFIKDAQLIGWYLKRICTISTTNKKIASRRLILLSKQATTTDRETLTIQKNGHYTDEFILLTKAFYLKM